jgi:hypothetical protein
LVSLAADRYSHDTHDMPVLSFQSGLQNLVVVKETLVDDAERRRRRCWERRTTQAVAGRQLLRSGIYLYHSHVVYSFRI